MNNVPKIFMQTYSERLYEGKAQQGRDEPPAGQCRMGVSMGYPPLTQKFLVLKKKLRCGKIQLKGLCMVLCFWHSYCFAFKTILFDSLIVLYYSFL